MIDACIHQERLDINGLQKTFNAPLTTLPDGSFVRMEGNTQPYLWLHQNLYEWSFSGYNKVLEFEKNQTVIVLTPISYIEVFKAGYVPQVHASAAY